MTDLGLSAYDLRTIADALDVVETDERLTTNPVFGRIEVIRPETTDDVCGYFVKEDGDWYGFRQEG